MTRSSRIRPLLAFFVLVALSSICVLAAPDTGQTLQTIRARYAIINQELGKCITVNRDLNGRSTEGGTLTGYRSGKSFRKITATFYGETGKSVEEYYFWNGDLIFVLHTAVHYNQPMGAHIYNTPPGTVKSTSQERFYLDNGKLIRQLGENSRPQPIDGKAAQDRARQLANDARDYLALLASPASKE